ncbi:MAG: hypothetical protein ABI438_08705 [Dermatophilaceae bacterium]
MPHPVRRALAIVVFLLGGALAIFGSWTAVTLGPSGEASFTATSKGPGVLVVEPGILNSVRVPVRITATRSDGGRVRVAVAPSPDARALLAKSAVSTVSGVHFPAGSLDLRTSGAGTPSDISAADVWRLEAEGGDRTQLTVNQGWGPETAVVSPADNGAPRSITMTLTWADRSWFFDALAVAVMGSIIAAFALGDLWHDRRQPMSSVPTGPRHGGLV